ncbi:MAG: valine--tRNA ligase, partial [Candidatus Micrarchaeota archaeon]
LLQMFEKGLVSFSKHPVLWCPHCVSAIAKAETNDVERETKLNYVSFELVDGGALEIATTRPEMLHACVAVLFHQSDARFKKLAGKKIRVPVFNQEVPLLTDEDVDKEFGSGIVMVCTFGDSQDVVWAYRHKLPVVEAFTEDGKLQNAGDFNGLKAKEAREKILAQLKDEGKLLKQEQLNQVVKIHDRCKHAIEMISSRQWFIKLSESKQDVLKYADEMRWVPEHHKQLLRDWVDGLEWDWCFSRQRIFGIPIPFWYCGKCGEIVAPEPEQLPVDPRKDTPPGKCKCGGALKGVQDVCDGWVDSSITPLIVSGWPDSPQFKDLYPTQLRPQGTDIIRTWAFYTIFRCGVLTGKRAFDEILINGMVLGSDGKKMSKSLGNFVEAKDVMSKTSADALRQWAALSGNTGKDNAFFMKDVDRAQAFLTKLWNASRFVEKLTEGYEFDEADKPKLTVVDEWLLLKFSEAVAGISASMEAYDFYAAISKLHAFVWSDLCDNYLEDVKYRVYGDDAGKKKAAQYCLKLVLRDVLKMLAPLAPFASEEIYSSLYGGESIHSSKWPEQVKAKSGEDVKVVELLHSALSLVRQAKAEKAMALNKELSELTITAPAYSIALLKQVEADLKGVSKAAKVIFKEGESLTVDFKAGN